MFGWFKRKAKPPQNCEKISAQPPGEVFAWPSGWQLTALDELVLAIPGAIIQEDEVIGSIIHGDDGIRLDLPTPSRPTPDDRILLWLEPGHSVWLSRSCQGMVVPQFEDDTKPRRLQVTELANHAKQQIVPPEQN